MKMQHWIIGKVGEFRNVGTEYGQSRLLYIVESEYGQSRLFYIFSELIKNLTKHIFTFMFQF